MGDLLVPAGAAGLVPPPWLVGGSPIYVSGEDALALTVFNAAAAVRVRLTGRFLPVGSAQPTVFASELAPATDRTASTLIHGLGEGWLLEASVIVSSGSPLIGQTYATLAMQRGLATSALTLSALAQGYVTARQRIGTPGGGLQGSLDGAGALRSITGTDPGAGSDSVETVPTGARWELVAWEISLVTDATVASRRPVLVLDDGATEFFRSGESADHPASQTLRHIRAQGFGTVHLDQQGNFYGELPIRNALLAGYRLRTSTSNFQAGDNYGAPQLLVREWIEGA